jgi:hypothetical protein
MLCVRADGFCSPAITNISLDTNTIHFNPSNNYLVNGAEKLQLKEKQSLIKKVYKFSCR